MVPLMIFFVLHLSHNFNFETTPYLKGPCHGQLFFDMLKSFICWVQGHISCPNPTFGFLRIKENLKILVLVRSSKVAIRNNTGISKLAIRNNKGISKLAIRNNTWNSKLAIQYQEQSLTQRISTLKGLNSGQENNHIQVFTPEHWKLNEKLSWCFLKISIHIDVFSRDL